MSRSDQIEVYLVAAVFLCVGLAKIWNYKRSPRGLGAQSARRALPSWCIVAVGLFEVAAGLALVASGLLPQVALAQVAIAGLALLTVTACIYHARRRETMVPNVMLFLLVLFVVVVQWV